jgi:pSer/pThr/pTyr-binding forkhead associated (FHA) protein
MVMENMKESIDKVRPSDRISPQDRYNFDANERIAAFATNEMSNLQAESPCEMDSENSEEGDDLCKSIKLEINTNKSYVVDENGTIEFHIKNVSDEKFEKVSITAFLLNQKGREIKNIGTLNPLMKGKSFHLPFCHNKRGVEVVEIALDYLDSCGNPSVYKSQCEIKVLNSEEKDAGVKSVNISISGKIQGNDFSNMVNMSEPGKQPAREKLSSYESVQKQWKNLPMSFDEDETNRRRDEIFIKWKFKEGEEKFEEARGLIKNAESMKKTAAKETLEIALELLKKSEDCFKKILERDQDQEHSRKRYNEVVLIVSYVQSQINFVPPPPPALHLTSGALSIQGSGKKIRVYSKNRISMGRDSRNDIVLRIIPYEPRDEYPENWDKSTKISATHAEIINRAGIFFVRDLGPKSNGSTNGTYIDGKKMSPVENYPLRDEMKINFANILDLECRFHFESRRKEPESLDSCCTVLGEASDSCFGVDKAGPVNAIKLIRRNNFSKGEKYIILIRELTIGSSRNNAIALDSEKVSDIHAKLFYRDNQYWLEDLNSRYGTFVNGERLKQGYEIALGSKADIKLGDMEINFEGYK